MSVCVLSCVMVVCKCVCAYLFVLRHYMVVPCTSKKQRVFIYPSRLVKQHPYNALNRFSKKA